MQKVHDVITWEEVKDGMGRQTGERGKKKDEKDRRRKDANKLQKKRIARRIKFVGGRYCCVSCSYFSSSSFLFFFLFFFQSRNIKILLYLNIPRIRAEGRYFTMGYEQFHVSNSHPGYLVTIPFMFDIPRIAQVSRRLIMKYVFSKDERCALSDNSSWDKYTRCLQKYRVPSMYPIFKRANRFIDFNSNEAKTG